MCIFDDFWIIEYNMQIHSVLGGCAMHKHAMKEEKNVR